MTKVMLIDDNGALRLILSDMLEEMECSVIEAKDGVEAMRLAARKKPDLIVTDIMMPNMDGIQTINELRRCYGEIPIIAISGGQSDDDSKSLAHAKAEGADKVLQKPFSFSDFESSVRTLLGDA